MKLFLLFTCAMMTLMTGCQSGAERAAAARDALASANLHAPTVDAANLPFPPATRIGVKRFEVRNANAGTREFESSFFAAELLAALQQSRSKASCVFAPVETPAVDYVVRGHASPGPYRTWVEVTVEDLTGRKIWSGPFSRDDWSTIANRILKETSADVVPRAPIEAKRVELYSGGAVTVANENTVSIGNLGARMECDKLLSHYGELAIANAEAYRKVYEALRERQRELAQAAEEENSRRNAAMVSAFAAGLGGIGAAASGNQAGVAQAQLQMAEGQVAVQASINREQNIEAASRKLTESFGQAVGSTSISFLDKSYQLSGSYDEQLKEFRAIIQRALIDAAGSK